MTGIRAADGSGIRPVDGRHRDSVFPCREDHVLPWNAFSERHPPQESPMTSVRTVLVVGGGTAGCALAALLARSGVAVRIVERNPRFTALGSGITLGGPA